MHAAAYHNNVFVYCNIYISCIQPSPWEVQMKVNDQYKHLINIISKYFILLVSGAWVYLVLTTFQQKQST